MLTPPPVLFGGMAVESNRPGISIEFQAAPVEWTANDTANPEFVAVEGKYRAVLHRVPAGSYRIVAHLTGWSDETRETVVTYGSPAVAVFEFPSGHLRVTSSQFATSGDRRHWPLHIARIG